MAIPIDFLEANANYGKPEGWRDDQCTSLPVYQGEVKDEQSGEKYPNIISKWKFTPEELEELNRNGGEFFLNMIIPVMVPVSLFVVDPFAEQIRTVVNIAGKGCLLQDLRADFDDADGKPNYYRGGCMYFKIPDEKVYERLESLCDAGITFPLSYLTLNSKGESLDSGSFIDCTVNELSTKKAKDGMSATIFFNTIQSHQDGK